MLIEMALTGLVGTGIGGLAGYAFASRAVGNLFRVKSEADEAETRLEAARDELERNQEAAARLNMEITKLSQETEYLQSLAGREQELETTLTQLTSARQQAIAKARAAEKQLEERTQELNNLMGKLDLYTRIDEFAAVGHFEVPDYLFDTAERFKVEIERIRDDQKAMIKAGTAVDLPSRDDIVETKSVDINVLKNQAKLMLRAFNIECDLLIGKVNPGNLSRTLQQIEKTAEAIDKAAASLHCGLSAEYVELRYQECGVYYQYKLRKAEEQEEQRQLREQMREEARVRAEYERAEKEAEKQQLVFERLLDQARKQAAQATEAERSMAEAKIAELEAQLAAATAERERAKSMAEQTRRGHVYVISNVGSFGPNVYKIGLTRRLDPMDRVKELGDASVPFGFDVHAMIAAEDAPALEAELHRRFNHRRVNAVNLRKEFFRVTLDEIQATAEGVIDDEVDFVKTIAAEEYYETRRIQGDGKSTTTPPG